MFVIVVMLSWLRCFAARWKPCDWRTAWYIPIAIWACVYVCMFVCMYVCSLPFGRVCMYVCSCVCMYALCHLGVCVCMYVPVYVCSARCSAMMLTWVIYMWTCVIKVTKLPAISLYAFCACASIHICIHAYIYTYNRVLSSYIHTRMHTYIHITPPLQLAKPSLISPLGAVSVVINVPVGWCVLGEKPRYAYMYVYTHTHTHTPHIYWCDIVRVVAKELA
jgi:hypothetical protein